jgi:DNA-3-methyladenine glycosylase I
MEATVTPALKRCWWAQNPLSIRYHDEEWGVPSHDDQHLFEMIVLEGAQAGLSWDTILRKRDNYRRAFVNFEIDKIARFNGNKMTRLLADEGIVRNRLKIEAAIQNARAVKKIQKEFGSLGRFLWQFAPPPRKQPLASLKQVPARTAESDRLSQELQKRGLRFVGSTICYAFMQAVGMVNDHLEECFRYKEISSPPTIAD